MSLAKPLAGGLPIGAVLLKEKVAAAMKPGERHVESPPSTVPFWLLQTADCARPTL